MKLLILSIDAMFSEDVEKLKKYPRIAPFFERALVSKDMAPNFYVHASLIQPHAQTVNDLPIRMYGIEGAEVIDRKTILHPVIEVADEILPQQEFTIKVREQDGKPMSYTLAIVDEGLLDITAFKTPQPWPAMNQREALGVKTWDMYEDVIGAYAGKFSSILSIGGDEALRRAAGKEKRFNPVVKFLGPFTLDKGTKTHKITLPMYVGSVRVMVVAAKNGTYGDAGEEAFKKIADEINELKDRQLEERHRKQLAENYEQRIMDMDEFLKENTVKLIEFDDELVRRIVSRINVLSEDRIQIQFKSGIILEEGL